MDTFTALQFWFIFMAVLAILGIIAELVLKYQDRRDIERRLGRIYHGKSTF